MPDTSIKLSSRGAFSYHWNKCIKNKESCFIKVVKSLVGFFQGLFGGYTVSEYDIISILNDEIYKEKVFYKEYQIKLGNRKTEIVNEAASVEQSINDKKQENSIKSKEGNNFDKPIELEIKSDDATKTKKVSVECSIFDQFEELIKNDDVKLPNKCFKQDTLALLNEDDALLLFSSALAKDNFKCDIIAYGLLEVKGGGEKFANLSGDNKKNALSFFSRTDDAPRLKKLLDQGTAEINDINSHCTTAALIAAIVGGSEKCLKVLLAHGVDVNMPFGLFSPIHCATTNGKKTCLTLLLDAGADVNSLTQNGKTAVYCAVLENRAECLEVLLRREGVDEGVIYEETPLECAKRLGHQECIDLLRNFSD